MKNLSRILYLLVLIEFVIILILTKNIREMDSQLIYQQTQIYELKTELHQMSNDQDMLKK
jgi:predicted Holliday junction resolvase-like endonuclease